MRSELEVVVGLNILKISRIEVEMKNKLKARRENLGLSVEQVAERMIEPFRQTYIELIKDNERQNRLENDDLPEDQSWDKLLAKALECKIEDLI